MSRLKPPSRPCIALIADMVKSRQLSPSQRPKIQEHFRDFVSSLNKSYARHILSKFIITLGDEFQGLLSSATPIPRLMWDIDLHFRARRLRVGLGFGVLHTPLQKEAINIDGPALHFARAALERAAEERSFGGVFFGFGDLDPVLNGFARILWFHRSKFTAKQLRIVDLLRRNPSQTAVAHELRVSRQAISKHVASAGWRAYAEAQSAWEVVLEKYVNPKFEGKHA
jgi:hypothetical protein